MTRPADLRADQRDTWERETADRYGGPDHARVAHPAEIDPGWLAEGTRAIADARARRAD